MWLSTSRRHVSERNPRMCLSVLRFCIFSPDWMNVRSWCDPACSKMVMQLFSCTMDIVEWWPFTLNSCSELPSWDFFVRNRLRKSRTSSNLAMIVNHGRAAVVMGKRTVDSVTCPVYVSIACTGLLLSWQQRTPAAIIMYVKRCFRTCLFISGDRSVLAGPGRVYSDSSGLRYSRWSNDYFIPHTNRYSRRHSVAIFIHHSC